MGKRHKECLEALSSIGPATAKEVAIYLFNKGYTKILERNIAHPRLKELVDRGKVKVIGKKKDNKTNRNVSIYSKI